MSRIPLIAGNWKMFKTIPETVDFCKRLKAEIGALQGKRIEVAVAPPFTAIAAAAQALQGSPIRVASQDAFWAESGAYTGEISVRMLKDAGCSLGIVGHSERRQYFQETDDSVNKKAVALMKEGIIPIVCVGETLAERCGPSAPGRPLPPSRLRKSMLSSASFWGRSFPHPFLRRSGFSTGGA
jgi:triosephosphate isomerase